MPPAAARLPQPPLLVISDRGQVVSGSGPAGAGSLVAVAEAAFAAGCRWFSLREKDLPAEARRDLLENLVSLGRRHGATVIAHEEVAAVLAAGAGGVHLPAGGDPAAARRVLPHGVVGASAHSAAEARSLLDRGADYVTLSPIFVSPSKPLYGPALGLDGLARATAGTAGAIVALGGVGAANAALCRRAGARGIAVMGEVMRAADPEAAVRRLLLALDAG
jgi:thiamine-phosphate pyrophosphorylase